MYNVKVELRSWEPEEGVTFNSPVVWRKKSIIFTNVTFFFFLVETCCEYLESN